MARIGVSPFGRTPESPDGAGEPRHDRAISNGESGEGENLKGRKLIFGICAIALFMGSIDATIVATALPRIDHELHAPINWAGWSITIYQLGQIIAMPLAGKLSDQFGRKRVFLLSVVLFTGTSLFCGLSTSIYMLVGLRFIQSLGGGAFMPSASGIVSDHYGKDRDRALGMFSSIFPIGGIVGPVFGGVIAQDWTWRGIFFINIPIGIALVILGLKFIPRVRPKGSEGLDLPGVALLGGTLLIGMYGITTLGNVGGSVTSVNFVVAEVVAFVAGYFFLRHTKHTERPFIPRQLLLGKGFGTMNVLNILYGSTALGFGALVPLYAENRYHIDLTNAGTLLSARALGMVAVAAAATLLMRRTGYRLPMIVGFTTVAIGLVMLSVRPPAGFSPYLWLAAFSTLTGLGMGCSAPATNNATMQLAPEQVAAIAGQRGMFRQTGGIFYISVATAFLARSHNPGAVQAHLFLVQAVTLVIMMAIVFRVPEHKGRW